MSGEPQTSPIQINYALRRIDLELWGQVRSRAKDEGRAVRFVILALLRLYQEHGLDAIKKAMDA